MPSVPLTGIPSEEAFGTLPTASTTYLSGIPSEEAFSGTWDLSVVMADDFNRPDAANLGGAWDTYYFPDTPDLPLATNAIFKPAVIPFAGNTWGGDMVAPFVIAIDLADDYFQVGTGGAAGRQMFFEWADGDGIEGRGVGIGLYANWSADAEDIDPTVSALQLYEYTGTGLSTTDTYIPDRQIVAGTGLALSYDGESARAWLRPPGSGWELVAELPATIWAAEEFPVQVWLGGDEAVDSGLDNFQVGSAIPSITDGGLTPTSYTSLTGIATEEAFGTPSIMRYVPLGYIPSDEAVNNMSGSTGVIPSYIHRPLRPLSVTERFSTPIVNQNDMPTGAVDLANFSGTVTYDDGPEEGEEDYSVYQEFYHPRDYVRASTTSEAIIPPLTGFQVLVGVGPSNKDSATLDWRIERYEVGVGWIEVKKGTKIGAARTGEKVWYTVYFDEPLEVLNEWLDDRFRIGLRGREATGDQVVLREEVIYENGEAIVGTERIEVRLEAGIPYGFINQNGVYSLLQQDPISKRVYHSTQAGITDLWGTAPNPLATQSLKAYQRNGSPLTLDGEECSINFRVLAGVAEEGVDFLGNKYRSSVIKNSVTTVSSTDSAYANSYWQSKPNPSKFAVESLYFDISSNNQARTVDHVLIDPLTPGVFFSVYYSSEGEAGNNTTEWDQKLWTRVPNTFQTKERYTHALPQPITAKFIKVEFTHLQPKWYAPGNFEKSILYRKHPKWVIDYFLARTEVEKDTEDPFIARRIGVRYDALSLAYEYYLDDLNEAPLSGSDLGVVPEGSIHKFFEDRSDESDRVDPETLAQIKTSLSTYTKALGSLGKLDYLLSVYSLGAVSALQSGERVLTPDYPVEQDVVVTPPNTQVSSIRREGLVIENNYPVMNFFVPCRHNYRELTATFKDDKAYWAGVKEIAFLRDRYTEASDTDLYVESAGDTLNTERNDFELEDNLWTVYSSSELANAT